MKTYVNNTAELSAMTDRFDTAVSTELYYGNTENPQALKDWKGVFNMNTNKVASVVSKDYKIIQHNDVFNTLTATLNNLNIDVFGLVDNRNNKVKMDLVFANQGTPVVDDATGVKLGIRAINSYDRTSAFRLEMFGYRTVCKNGMAFGKVMGVREITIHMGQEKSLEKIEAITTMFIKNVMNSSTTLQAYINRAIGDSIEWEMLDKILPKLFAIEKHRKQIINRLKMFEPTTRWELYNAVTHYVTHDLQLKPSAEAYLELRSREILSTPFNRLEEKYCIAEVF